MHEREKMKRECSYIELFYLVKEWQDLVGSRITKIVVSDELIVFELFKSGGKKSQLNGILPMAWVGEYKYAAPTTPPSFAVQLRKLLEGQVIKKIRLVEGERIVIVECGEYSLVLQLFGKGNVMVLKDGVVCAALRQGSISGLSVRMHESLVIKDKADPRVQTIVRTSDSLSSVLAKTGLGKVYAQEVVLRAGEKSLTKVKSTVTQLFKQKIRACVVKDADSIVDVTPFPLKYYAHYSCESYDSFNAALNAVLSRRVQLLVQERIAQSFDARLQRIKSAIAAQELHLKTQKEEAQKNQEYGELLYEHYAVVKEVLEVLQQARKKYSWDEIKSRLKNHPVIKEVDEKNGKVVVELKH